MHLFMRLTVTPALTCPNFDSKTSSIYNLTMIETLYYAAYRLFGAVADQEKAAYLTQGDGKEGRNIPSKPGKRGSGQKSSHRTKQDK